jgi:hypothetical protein
MDAIVPGILLLCHDPCTLLDEVVLVRGGPCTRLVSGGRP